MRIDEGRRQQQALGVDGLAGRGLQLRLDRGNASGFDADIDAPPAVGEGGIAHDQVEHGLGCLLRRQSLQDEGHTSGTQQAIAYVD